MRTDFLYERRVNVYSQDNGSTDDRWFDTLLLTKIAFFGAYCPCCMDIVRNLSKFHSPCYQCHFFSMVFWQGHELDYFRRT